MSILLAATLGVVFTGIGVAIDLHSLRQAEAGLQSQADVGILAAAVALEQHEHASGVRHTDGQGDFDFADEMYSIMMRNGYSDLDQRPVITQNGRTYSAEITVPHKTMFGSFIGKPEVNIVAKTGVTMGSMDRMEIALVFDNTASMGLDGKFGALRIGSYRLVDAIRDSNSGTKIALVPFAKYVRLDPDNNRNEPWLSVPPSYETERTWQQAVRTGGTCTTEETTIMKDGYPYTYDADVCTGQTTTYEERSRTMYSQWEGCVGTRDEPDNEDDSNYSAQIPGLMNTHPYEETGQNTDVEAWCPYRLTPLTNDYAAIRQDIQNHYPTDTTYIPAGLMWGRRVLSRHAPFEQADTDGQTRQALILLSDGKNTSQIDNSAISQADMTAPPYVKDVGETDSAPKADALTLQMCEDIKADGIEIFTIAFRVGHTPTEAILAECASDAEHAFIAGDNDRLIEVLENLPSFFEGDIRLTR